MHRIDGPYSPGGVFTEGVPATFTRPSFVSAAILNAFQEEIAGVIEGAGLTLSKPDNGQLEEALDLLFSGVEPLSINWLLNPEFRIWQRGESETIFGTSGFTADRWRVTTGTGGVADVNRRAFTPGQVLVPGEPADYFELEISGTPSTAPAMIQRIEDVRKGAGQDAFYSFWARVQSGTLSVTPGFIQNFGTGGSSKVTTLDSPVVITTTWQKFSGSLALPSISGKTLGADGDGFEDHFLTWGLNFPDSTDFTIEVAQCQAFEGDVDQFFVRRPIAAERKACRRFFQMSYGLGQHPGDVADGGHSGGFDTTPDAFDLQTKLYPELRAKPTVTWYEPTTGASDSINWQGGGLAVVVVNGQTGEGTTSTGYPSSAASARSGQVSGHWTTEAEL